MIFRIIFNLFRLSLGLFTRLLWLPVILITRNLFLVILLVIAVLIYRYFAAGESPREVTPAPVSQPASAITTPSSGQANQPVRVDPIMRNENGDSAFATDLYAAMSEEERALYSQHFFYAMSHMPNGQSHGWNGGNIEGVLTPNNRFTNSYGTVCRQFSERWKVHAIQQTLTGTACQKPGGGWCKLRPNATPACGLGGKPGFWQQIKNLF